MLSTWCTLSATVQLLNLFSRYIYLTVPNVWKLFFFHSEISNVWMFELFGWLKFNTNGLLLSVYTYPTHISFNIWSAQHKSILRSKHCVWHKKTIYIYSKYVAILSIKMKNETWCFIDFANYRISRYGL